MADYIYLLQNRLSPAQQAALQTIRDVARAHGQTVFLVGGAVRDLTSGSPVRDLDVVVQGNALKLKKDLELAGAISAGEVISWQSLFATFVGGVRMEIGSTLSVTYPKPGKPVIAAASILDDLRRRDFTVNAMALSLNEGSYGLLMDPLNGVADIENRQLRLVSNYGFIEDPVRMIRAARFSARLGWTMDEKTQQRYETGKAEKYIGALSNVHRGYETEEIFHEEDPLRILRRLEEEGWMKHLFPAITAAKANAGELERLRELQTQLQMSGIDPDASAAHFPLLTAKLSASEVAELKKSFVRQGFVREVEGLEAEAKNFAAQLSDKHATLPSQAWKLIHAAKPEAVLWAAYSSKNLSVQTKLKSFQTEWPKARQKMPFPLMAEMRIVPELDTFNDVVDKVFFELMDGNLATPEEQKAFLEPFSPPAPPPPVRLGRSRAGKKDGKAAKGKKKIAETVDEDEDDDLDRETDHHEDEVQAAQVPDDENEDTDIAAPLTEESEVTGVVDDPPAPESVSDPEPVSEPVQAASEPVIVVAKPKRVRPQRTKAAPPAPVEALAAAETVVPPAPPKPAAETKKTELDAKTIEPAKVAPKVPTKASRPTVTAKPPVEAAKSLAKKATHPTPPAKAGSAGKSSPVSTTKASAKTVTPPAKKSQPVKAAPPLETPALKAPPAPSKKAAQKR